MKVFAGEKLYGRNPMQPPATAQNATHTGIMPSLIPWIYATYARDSAIMAVLPAASPSRPSMRFTALVMPTIHNTVMRYARPAPKYSNAFEP